MLLSTWPIYPGFEKNDGSYSSESASEPVYTPHILAFHFFRPQILVLCGNAASRPSLVDFANNITKGTSLMICGYVVPVRRLLPFFLFPLRLQSLIANPIPPSNSDSFQYNPSDRVYSVMRKLERQLSEWLRKRRVKAFYAAVANASLRAGSQSLLQVGLPQNSLCRHIFHSSRSAVSVNSDQTSSLSASRRTGIAAVQLPKHSPSSTSTSERFSKFAVHLLKELR